MIKTKSAYQRGAGVMSARQELGETIKRPAALIRNEESRSSSLPIEPQNPCL
ncbi:MAG: hypothetical protein LBF87_04575 [Treponema sp.]|nr:hypothetical protein [Treponema sp.]